MRRMTVKLLLIDPQDRMLLIHSADRSTGRLHWYPVGGGVEPGESLQQAAAREAYEEAGLASLPSGEAVWTRDHTYAYDGRKVDVHEDWLLHRVPHFNPAPASPSAYEAATIRSFRWWSLESLATTDATVFPPRLGELLTELLRDGTPATPIDISS